ncbi:hypothetical protein QQF64_031777 [Cirrhinus molitorella]|uniref:Uncharacterized protein n=1 Tax=Cirrhinus molitorella TaxID=172907 RepID=A0ABR3MXW5_9TELE
MEIENDQAKAIVNFIQTQKPSNVLCKPVRVGLQDVLIPAGQVAQVKCKVPEDFDLSDPFLLFEYNQENPKLDQLDLGDGLLEVCRTKRSIIRVPVGSYTKHDILLPRQTALGNIQPIAKIVETNQTVEPASTEVNSAETTEESDDKQVKATSRWEPPVDISHLTEEQQKTAKKMLYEESLAFERNDEDVGCIPNLQMTVNLTDDIPVQRSYSAVPKPLYKEVKEYIQDLLAKGWIVKSKSPYSAPVVCVRKKDGTLRLCVD